MSELVTEREKCLSFLAQNYKDRSKIETRNMKIWIEEVEKLYQKIEEWLNEYIEKGDIIVETDDPQTYSFDDDVGMMLEKHIQCILILVTISDLQ